MICIVEYEENPPQTSRLAAGSMQGWISQPLIEVEIKLNLIDWFIHS